MFKEREIVGSSFKYSMASFMFLGRLSTLLMACASLAPSSKRLLVLTSSEKPTEQQIGLGHSSSQPNVGDYRVGKCLTYLLQNDNFDKTFVRRIT